MTGWVRRICRSASRLLFQRWTDGPAPPPKIDSPRKSRGLDEVTRLGTEPEPGPTPPSALQPALPEAGAPAVAFPSIFLRGQKSSKWVKPNGRVSPEAFEFNKKSPEPRRQAGKRPALDVSINWEIDAGAEEALRQDKTNAAHGVIEVPRATLEWLLKDERLPADCFFWEFDDLGGTNVYHGNIAYTEETPVPCREAIHAMLANGAKRRSDPVPTTPDAEDGPKGLTSEVAPTSSALRTPPRA